MRHPCRAIARLTHACAAGQAIRGVLLPITRRPGVLQACLSAIGSDREDVGPAHDSIRDARNAVGATSIDPLQSEIHNCTLCAGLLSAWARCSCDPDTDVVSWLTEGAPAGILDHPVQMGIFPDAVEAAVIMDLLDGDFGDPAIRMSYASVEEDDDAVGELNRLGAAGFIKKFATLDLSRGATPAWGRFSGEPRPGGCGHSCRSITNIR